MAVLNTNDYVITVGGTDFSDHLSSITLDISVEELDDTAFGDTARSRIGGLEDGSVALNFHQDYAASQVDVTLWGLKGTVTSIVAKPTSGSVSATNPSYTVPALVTQLAPVSGQVGELAVQQLSWPKSGAVARATS